MHETTRHDPADCGHAEVTDYDGILRWQCERCGQIGTHEQSTRLARLENRLGAARKYAARWERRVA
ncbi:hypothetical protein [Nocardioides mesophilus]|uniref:Uncharacterized protein n=1 Tax=Nocardioides mesophilus TaxID=433659 RepID=A0A7G9REC6_9ACTN|nr:hypothetical protein [Nocardioides mesophilus]QNN53951.1 hypothetical protein H9L09_06090 [Nocardioides mesophilus]